MSFPASNGTAAEFKRIDIMEDEVFSETLERYRFGVRLPTEEQDGAAGVLELREPGQPNRTSLLTLIESLESLRQTKLEPVLSTLGLWSIAHREPADRLRLARVTLPSLAQIARQAASIILPKKHSLPRFAPYEDHHYPAEVGLRAIAEEDTFLISTRATEEEPTLLHDMLERVPAQCALPPAVRKLIRAQAQGALDGKPPPDPDMHDTDKTPAEQCMASIHRHVSFIEIGLGVARDDPKSRHGSWDLARNYIDLLGVDHNHAFKLAEETRAHVQRLGELIVSPDAPKPAAYLL